MPSGVTFSVKASERSARGTSSVGGGVTAYGLALICEILSEFGDELGPERTNT